MRVAVYAIARDEVAHVPRFLASCEGADLVFVADTGSTDGTVEALENGGAVVRSIAVRPWRFDDARNASLALLPSDIDVCIALDIDEVLNPGWITALRAEWVAGTTRASYLYHWSHHADGSPAVSFWTDKIHARFGYRWRHACHEAVYPDRTGERRINLRGVWIDHWADLKKSRSNYLPLLQLAVREDPRDARHAYYLGREYSFVGKLQEAEAELRRYLALPSAVWRVQNADAMRIIAKARRVAGDHQGAVDWLERAVATAPESRDARISLAEQFFRVRDWARGYEAVGKALTLPRVAAATEANVRNMGAHPHELAAYGASRLGRLDEALAHAERALELDPTVERYERNVQRIRAALRRRTDDAAPVGATMLAVGGA